MIAWNFSLSVWFSPIGWLVFLNPCFQMTSVSQQKWSRGAATTPYAEPGTASTVPGLPLLSCCCSAASLQLDATRKKTAPSASAPASWTLRKILFQQKQAPGSFHRYRSVHRARDATAFGTLEVHALPCPVTTCSNTSGFSYTGKLETKGC